MSSRYTIEIHRYKGQPISASLIDRTENKTVKKVFIDDIGCLGLYKITKANQKLIDRILSEVKGSRKELTK